MTYPRINLLNKSEQRYQGVVSRRFIVTGLVAVPIIAIALVGSVKLIHANLVKSDLRGSRRLWSELKPQLADYQLQRSELSANRSALELIDGWKQSKVPVEGLLQDIQDKVPANVQLSRLSIRSESGRRSFEKVQDMAGKRRMVIQGLSQGELAEQTVINLRRDLLQAEYVADTFDSIRLGALRKQAADTREFTLEGVAEEGGKK